MTRIAIILMLLSATACSSTKHTTDAATVTASASDTVNVAASISEHHTDLSWLTLALGSAWCNIEADSVTFTPGDPAAPATIHNPRLSAGVKDLRQEKKTEADRQTDADIDIAAGHRQDIDAARNRTTDREAVAVTKPPDVTGYAILICLGLYIVYSIYKIKHNENKH